MTAANPYPMEIELEKVYQPCVLLTKKRYAGWMYEHEGQQHGELDAKVRPAPGNLLFSAS